MTTIIIFLGLLANPVLAQNLPINANELIRGTGIPIFEISAHRTTAVDASVDNLIRSPNHLSCIRSQIDELKKVAEMSGGVENLKREMQKKDIQFRIVSADERQSKKPLNPKEKMRIDLAAPGLIAFNVFSRVYVDKKTSAVKCDVVKATDIYTSLTNSKGLALKLKPLSTGQRSDSKGGR